MVLVVSHNRSFLNEVANEIAVIAHRRLAVFQGTFKDSWAAAKMAEFMAVQPKPRYRGPRAVNDGETGHPDPSGGANAGPVGAAPGVPGLLTAAEGPRRVVGLETGVTRRRC